MCPTAAAHSALANTRHAALTVRVAGWSARHRWLVLGLWIAATFGCLAANLALGGQRFLSVEDSQATIGDSVRGAALFEHAGPAGSSQRFDVVVSTSEARLDTAAGRAAVAEIAASLASATIVANGQDQPAIASVVDPFEAAAANPAMAGLFVSSDRSSVIVSGSISGSATELADRVRAARTALDASRAAHPDLTILSLNAAQLEDDLMAYGERSTGLLLLVTLPLTLLILVAAFRALVAAAVPLLLGLTGIVGAMGIVGGYSRLVGPVSPFAAEFVVLIGLAVAIDYSLFIISRFRSERSSGRGRLDAIEIASGTAGRAVLFSGSAVAISMASLFLLDDPIVVSFAVGSIAAVLVSVVGTMTFLPAMLSVLDRGLDRGRLPFHVPVAMDGSRFWAHVVSAATRHAPVVSIATAALLVLLASPIVGLRLGSSADDLSTMPAEIEGVQAARLMSQEWPQGSNLTLDVIVTDAANPMTRAAISRLEASAASIASVAGPARETRSGDASVARISFVLSGSANEPANAAVVRQFRADLVPQAFAGAPGSHVDVAGDAAYALDYASFYEARTVLVVAFVLGLSFLLLLVAFHSIAIPIKAILLNLLSFGSAFGVMVAVFHGGSSVIDAANPVMMFAILFGLSMDYHVFILSRVKEARDSGESSAAAVATGISMTSGTVTSAAAIMVCVFATFCTIAISNIQQFGFGMTVAVLIDATLVRSLLLPATMWLLGDWNWWLPRFLRWLPRVEIEVRPRAPRDELTRGRAQP